MSVLKRVLMYLYTEQWISFETTEWIAAQLRRFRAFREG